MQVVVFCKNVLILSNNNSNFLTSCFYPSTFVYGWFFLKDWVFLLFAKSVNWDLQILGKCISDTLFGFKAYMSYITEKHQFPCEYYGLVIKYTKSHPPNWCIKVGNTPPRLPYWWGVILFFFFFLQSDFTGAAGPVWFKNRPWKKTLWSLFMDKVQLSQGDRATTRRQFTFYHLVPRTS